MRKLLLISQLLVILLFCCRINAQNPRLEINYSVVAESALKSANADLNITVDGDQPPYIYQLFDKAPWEGGKELKRSDSTMDVQYSFINLKTGNYLVCVTDSEGNSKCEYVTIKNE